MAFVRKLRKIGNSVGLTIPREVLARLNLGVGDTVYLTSERDGLRIRPCTAAFADAMEAFEACVRRYPNALRKLADS